MRLKARLRVPSSSARVESSTRTPRSPLRTRSAAEIKLLMGRASWVACAMPTQTAASNSSTTTSTKMIAKMI